MEIIAENKKALFDYEVLDKYQAGIVLIGQEVKAIKQGRINLQGSYVVLKDNELFLLNANVPPYQPKNAPKDYDPKRSRKLLLTKREIDKIIGKTHQKGLTLAPLKVYNHLGKIKIEFAVMKGKKQIDKREQIKRREVDIEIRRALKR